MRSEVVRGSHLGSQYNGTSYNDANDHTEAVVGQHRIAPRCPTVRPSVRETWRRGTFVSWDLEPGDALVFHSGSLHGGAPVTPDCPDRHTLVYRFHGDKLFYTGPCRPEGATSAYDIGRISTTRR
ncbi:phytanoyl-CoA dioxygenase family protein [Cupriavidus basilensis]